MDIECRKIPILNHVLRCNDVYDVCKCDNISANDVYESEEKTNGILRQTDVQRKTNAPGSFENFCLA